MITPWPDNRPRRMALARLALVTPRMHIGIWRTVWDFVAAAADLRCLVCSKRIDYDDHTIFECTSLCRLCAEAASKEPGA
jgi:hypothetical protein